MPPLIIAIKFAEIALRAVFVILITYTLKLEEAGQFGIVVTLQGLASFAFGYERQIDLQRRLIGEPAKLFDHAILRAFLFFCGNYVLFSPFFLLVLFFAADITGVTLALCVAVAIGEHISNLAYHLTLVDRRYSIYLYASFFKTALIFVLSLVLFFFNSLDLENVLIVWGVLASCLILMAVFYWLKTSSLTQIQVKTFWKDIASQYKLSRAHFLIGVLAVLSLQLDRLVVGAVLPFELAGVYFRHVLISALVYQVFNVGFYSMLVPKIFMAAKTEPVHVIVPLITKAYFKVLLFIVLVLSILVVLYLIGGEVFHRFNIDPFLLVGLLLACSIRIRADLNALIFNAFYRENIVLKMQSVCLFTGVFSSVVLTYLAGLQGLIIASIFMSAVYLGYTYYSLKQLAPDMNKIHLAS
jgi:O-antigen/teichoic acid export membrane protein